MTITLAYWKIRGLGQPCRYLLEYTGLPWECKYYECNPPDFCKDHWFEEKKTLTMDFPNLPYLIDGDVQMTQTNAVLAYIARKADEKLVGTTIEEKAFVDMLAMEIMDLRNALVKVAYCREGKEFYQERFDAHFKRWSKQFASFDNFLKDKKWLIGDQITYPDFHLYEMVYQHQKMKPDIFDKFPNIKAFMERFEALPAIKKYNETEEVKSLPCNQRFACFH
eukprot:GFYU01011603.1.p2 GENE.GFYU01011603.1~~GFYU01011603.1.p2  ORF type:complete len:222 (-),score=52.99 GFYU01011603.1:224-889(-)